MASLAGCGGIYYRNLGTGSGGSGSDSTAPELSGITCAIQSLTGAQSSTCTVTLSGKAGSTTNVTLTSNNSALEVPSVVTIAVGATSGSFNAVATAVTKTTSVTITGKADGVSKTDVITLNPETKVSPVSLSSISCGTQSLTGAQSKACTASLSGIASGATSVALTSSNSALEVPSVVTIAAGASSEKFKAVSSTVSKTTSVTITGKADGVSKTDVITLYPATTNPISLSKLSCASLILTGSTTTACQVSLSGSAISPVQVSLSSNNSALKVQPSVTVLAGSTNAGFVATAFSVTTTQNVTLTASSNGVSETNMLQLDPLQADPAAQYKVQLSWNAPTTSIAIAGYDIYRAISGSSYRLMNSAIEASTNYTDTTVQSGQTYDYVVRSVDSAGAESPASNATTITIP